MSANDIKILNAALSSAGENQITSLTDGSPEAEVASAVYERTVSAELAAHPYSFNVDYQELNRLSETPENEWTYVFEKPSQAIRIDNVEVNGRTVPYDAKGSKIYTNEKENVICEFGQRVDESQFPDDFVAALITRFEAIFTKALAEKDTEAEALHEKADLKFKMHRNRDAKNKTPRDRRSSRLTRVRG